MASRMIGRATCPECGFGAAHVKRSEKCLYRYCPDCGAQHYARGERAESLLMEKTRTEPGAAAPVTPSAPVATATGTAPATPSVPADTATGSDGTGTPSETKPTAKPRRGLF